MKLSRPKFITPVVALAVLSALSLFSACSKSEPGAQAGASALGSLPTPEMADKDQKQQKEDAKKKKLDEEGHELVAYLYTNLSPKDGTLKVMTSKGKEVLTANDVQNDWDVKVAGEVVAYKTTDKAAQETLYVFNRDGKELFKLDHAEIQKRGDEFKVSNAFIAVYKIGTQKLTVYGLQGQLIVDNVDAESDYKISDTLIVYQTPVTHKLIAKDVSGTKVIEADLAAGVSGTYRFYLSSSLFSFQRLSDGKFVAYHEKTEVDLATPPSDMKAVKSYVFKKEKVGPGSFKDAVVMDSSKKELRKIPVYSKVQLSKNHIALMDPSKNWTVTNMAGDKTLFGPAPVKNDKMNLRENFYFYFDLNNILVKNWENKELVNVPLYVLPHGAGLATHLVKSSNEVLTYPDPSGKQVILNYEGKQLVSPLEDATVILSVIE